MIPITLYFIADLLFVVNNECGLTKGTMQYDSISDPNLFHWLQKQLLIYQRLPHDHKKASFDILIVANTDIIFCIVIFMNAFA